MHESTAIQLGCTALAQGTLCGANLRDANLRDADLRDADLEGVDLRRANMEGANLRRAYLADGRTWEDYQRDHLAGLCQTPEVRARAIAAWGAHTWTDCPMHAAHGVTEPTSIEMAAWVALYDAGLLERPAE